jgi:chromosome segregation ATPase
MMNEKVEVVQAELITVHTSIEKLVGALISAKRKCEEEENRTDPSEKKIGKFRVEIAGNERKLTDLRQLRCERAQEELACRYLEVEQRLEQERGAREGMVLQESSVTGQLAAIQEKIGAFDCAPSWQLLRLTQQTKRIVVGPLRRALEVKLAAAEAGLNQARQQADDLASQLQAIRSQLSNSSTQEAALKAELEKLLVEGETHHRVIRGSPQEIRAVLREDSRIVVDRWGVEKLLQQFEKGFTEAFDRSFHLEAPKVLTFVVQDVSIAFWADTGEIAGSDIQHATSGDDVWPKSHPGLSFDLERERLERKRNHLAAQPVAV